MEKVKSTFITIVASLTCFCLIAGVALATANKLTEDKIAAAKAAALQEAIKKVAPEFDNDPSAEQYKAATADGDSLTIYPAKKGGQLVGAAVESNTKTGFGGEIRIMIGFDADQKIVNYSVLEHNETPGLGSKMEEWFRADKGKQSVLGRDMKGGALKVSKDGGEVDAITAATISSRAFLDAINRAYAAYAQGAGKGDAQADGNKLAANSAEGSSGATQQTAADSTASTSHSK